MTTKPFGLRAPFIAALSLLSVFTNAAGADPITVQQVSKGTVQAGIGVIGAVGSFFSFGAWDVSAAIHIFAVAVSNDIKVSSHAVDPRSAQAVTLPDLRLTRAQTDVPAIPEVVNATFNAAVNAELAHAATLLAATTATNRYFTALGDNDAASAAARQSEIRAFLQALRADTAATVTAFDDFSRALQDSGSDFVVDETAFSAFQADLATSGFPANETALFASLLPNIDPLLINSPPHFIHPVGFGLDQLSGIAFSDLEGTPPRFSTAVNQGALAVGQVEEVVGPFPVPEPSVVILLCAGFAAARIRLARRVRESTHGKAG